MIRSRMYSAGWFLSALLISALALTTPASAQDAATSEAAPAATAPAAVTPMPNATPMPGAANAATPMGEAKPGEKKEEAKDAAAEPKPVTRPAEPKKPADPTELKVRPDDDGKVSFSFKGQPWPAVLEWLADISGMSLEWQQVPAGYLDLTTRGRYSVDEVRDLLNSILLSRGYTLLNNGEVLMVVALKDLNVALVPRVAPEDLESRGRHELVRTFFDLKRLRAETLVEELKPVLSSYAKISALKTTNRLDIVETAGNLIRVRDLLDEEQSSSGQSLELRPFKLKHVRAEQALVTLQSLLGIKPDESKAALTPQQLQMQQQQAMMMAQQQQNQPKPPGQQPEKQEIYLAVNARENMILASATPDKLAIIEQALAYLDVPPERPGTLLGQVPRVKVYRLTGVDPAPVVKVLNELGNLSADTRLEIDEANKAIIANASLVDHVTIQTLIDRIDGSARSFHVIPLRKLDAEYVAGSIEFLMGGSQKEDNSSRSPYYYDYYYYSSRYGSQDKKNEKDSFQVEADIENNRLLLRANDVEIEEITQLLIKLGELTEDGRPDTMRVIPITPGAERDQLLERLKRHWPSISPNPLNIEQPRAAESPKEAPSDMPAPAKPKAEGDDLTARPATGFKINTAKFVNTELAQADAEDVRADDASTDATDARAAADLPSPQPAVGPQREQAPPVSISVGPRGLVVTSDDPEALDRLMAFIDEMTPVNHTYKVFTLRNTYATDVAVLLEDVFEVEEPKKSSSEDRFYRYYYGFPSSSDKKSERGRLSKRRPLKFVPDPVTNTILVQGANEEQLEEISALIAMWDKVEEPDSESARRTQIIQVRYGNATEVADVIKDVYRDLLSPNDKALANFQQQQQQQKEQQQVRVPYSYYDFGDDDEGSKREELPRFKGLLSIGVDKQTNTLVVSAPNYLLQNVVQMVQTLDESSRPTRPVVRVVGSNRLIHDPKMRESLAKLANGKEKADAKMNGATAVQPGMVNGFPNGQQQPQQNGQAAFGVQLDQ